MEAAEQPVRQAGVKYSSRRHFLPSPDLSLSLSLSLSVKLISAAAAGRAIQCRFRPRFYECLSDCHKFWGRRPRASAQWLGTLRLAGRSVGVCRALLEFQ